MKYNDEYLDGLDVKYLIEAVNWAKSQRWYEDDGSSIDHLKIGFVKNATNNLL